jgi:two-component system sensor histidine kinase TctE
MAGPAAAGSSIRRKLLLYLGGMSLLGLMVLFFAARNYSYRAADRSFDHLLVSSTLSIAGSVVLAEGRWQVDFPYAALDLLGMAPEDRVFYGVSERATRSSGASSLDARLITGYDDLPAPPRMPELDGDAVLFDAPYSGETVRFAAVARRVSSVSDQRHVIVQVGQTRRARAALAADMVLRALLPLALLSALMLVLSWFGVRQALRPLTRIERDLSRREPSDLKPLAGPVPQELEQMVSALNRFMGRLDSSNETLRAFMAEAAHQMRTPLAALHAQVQLALDDDDPRERQHSLEAIERNSSQLSRLLNQLLSDASVIHRASLQRFEPVDLAEVLHQAVHESIPQTQLLAGQRPDVRLALAAGPALVKGDALLLREALKNLIDNAFKYGQTGRGPLQLALTLDQDEWVVTVADHGPGIAPAEAEQVFERFVRGREAGTGGAGLGLAIVKRVVESHHGRIALSNRVEGGLIVTLRFPRVFPHSKPPLTQSHP